jgi:hypothetical protein
VPVSTVFGPVVPSAPTSACESTWLPPATVPIFSVTLPLSPTHVFSSSIEPVLRVLVKVQTTVWLLATARPLSVPASTGWPLSVQASEVAYWSALEGELNTSETW